LECTKCNQNKEKNEFSLLQRKKINESTRTCYVCIEKYRESKNIEIPSKLTNSSIKNTIIPKQRNFKPRKYIDINNSSNKLSDDIVKPKPMEIKYKCLVCSKEKHFSRFVLADTCLDCQRGSQSSDGM